MANGLLFFYFFWIFWIMITFFLPKTKQRTLSAVFVLLCLCFANSYIELGIPISITYILLLLGSIFLHTGQSRKFYHFFCVFTISIGYIAMLLWETNTPVWLFASREVLIPGMIVCITLLITSGYYNRLVCGVLGMCVGEFLFNVILYYFSFKETIGSMAFLDIVSVTIVLNVIIYLYKQVSSKFQAAVTQMTHKLPTH